MREVDRRETAWNRVAAGRRANARPPSSGRLRRPPSPARGGEGTRLSLLVQQAPAPARQGAPSTSWKPLFSEVWRLSMAFDRRRRRAKRAPLTTSRHRKFMLPSGRRRGVWRRGTGRPQSRASGADRGLQNCAIRPAFVIPRKSFFPIHWLRSTITMTDPNSTIEIFRVPLSKGQLRAVPVDDRNLLLLASHAVNQMVVPRRLLIFSLNFESKSDIENTLRVRSTTSCGIT